MEGQPFLSKIIKENYRKVYGGAYRLNARYLLDGDLPGDALKSYWKAFRNDPRYTLKHLNRILFALAAVIAGGNLARKLKESKSNNKTIKFGFYDENIWP